MLFANHRRAAHRGRASVRECPPPTPRPSTLGCLPHARTVARRRPAARRGAVVVPARLHTAPPPRPAAADGGQAVAGAAAGRRRRRRRRRGAPPPPPLGRPPRQRGAARQPWPRGRGGPRQAPPQAGRQRAQGAGTGGAQRGCVVDERGGPQVAHRPPRLGWPHHRRDGWSRTSTPGACDRQTKTGLRAQEKKATTHGLPYATSPTGASRSDSSACAHQGRDKT